MIHIRNRKNTSTGSRTGTARTGLGRTIPPVTDHIEGRYDEIVLEDVINKYGELEGQKMVGRREKYYVPFSKEAVDKAIARVR